MLYLMLFFFFGKILIRLSKLCVQNKKCRNQHQRLLKNMGAHSVVLDLLQIPYEKVSSQVLFSFLNFDTISIQQSYKEFFSLNYLQVSCQPDALPLSPLVYIPYKYNQVTTFQIRKEHPTLLLPNPHMPFTFLPSSQSCPV